MAANVVSVWRLANTRDPTRHLPDSAAGDQDFNPADLFAPGCHRSRRGKPIKLAEDKLGKCVVRRPDQRQGLRVVYAKASRSRRSHRVPSLASLYFRTMVRGEADERDVGIVHVGQRVTVASDSYPNKSFSGTVTKLASHHKTEDGAHRQSG